MRWVIFVVCAWVYHIHIIKWIPHFHYSLNMVPASNHMLQHICLEHASMVPQLALWSLQLLTCVSWLLQSCQWRLEWDISKKNGVSSNHIWEFWLGRTKDGLLRNSTRQTVLGIWVADAVPNGICISKYEWLMVQLTRNLYWVLVVVGMANRICSGSKYGWPIVQPIGYLVLGISMCWYS